MTKPTATVSYIESDFPVTELDHDAWEKGDALLIDKLWNGKPVPEGRVVEVSLLWSENSLYLRFNARQDEPVVVNEDPQTSTKTMELWERDVCELFLAPDARNRRRYFEFEVAPTGEWLDLIVDWTKDEPRDWEYLSGMETSARIGSKSVTMVMKIAWSAFGRIPKAGDVWLGNLFRCLGSDPDRGYLAWSPTMTKTPQYHVPEQFGEFVFGR